MIYMDYNATTPVLPDVRNAMLPFLSEEWGNPSSKYRFGASIKANIAQAREQVAALVGAQSSEVVFTSCATEANNAAIHSALLSNPSKRHIVTSAVEHSSVLQYCKMMTGYGYESTVLPVSPHGQVDLQLLDESIRSDTAVVSLMWANNETGVIWPIREIGEICARRGALFHCDAAQAVGKVPVDFGAMSIHLLTLSGHKIGAPKGIGALIVQEGITFIPLIVGGKQESGRRGGTENVPMIVALGKACEMATQHSPHAWDSIAVLRDQLEANLLQKTKGAYVNGVTPRLPNTLNVGFNGIDADSAVTFCDSNGICISTGSACMESAISPSHVIYAMTGNHQKAEESLRISLGLDSIESDIVALIDCLLYFTELMLHSD